MTTHDQKVATPPVKRNEAGPSRQESDKDDDACRCKSTSLMTPKQLLGLMWSDLAFWKKTKNT